MLTLGLKQYLGLTVSIYNGFGFVKLLACSAGGFGGFHLSIFRLFCRHFGFAENWENWGENDRLSEGVVFFPFPLPLPQFFFLPPTLGKLFTSPQLSTVFLFQDGGLNIRWKYISTRPAKIRLHCRLVNYNLSLHFTPGLQSAFYTD